ncbi:hypothetical protein ILUMI_15742, partial [Ignelater luminosus]
RVVNTVWVELKKGTIEAVPTNSIVQENNETECWWPPKAKPALLKDNTVPIENEGWRTHGCKTIKFY